MKLMTNLKSSQPVWIITLPFTLTFLPLLLLPPSFPMVTAGAALSVAVSDMASKEGLHVLLFPDNFLHFFSGTSVHTGIVSVHAGTAELVHATAGTGSVRAATACSSWGDRLTHGTRFRNFIPYLFLLSVYLYMMYETKFWEGWNWGTGDLFPRSGMPQALDYIGGWIVDSANYSTDLKSVRQAALYQGHFGKVPATWTKKYQSVAVTISRHVWNA